MSGTDLAIIERSVWATDREPTGPLPVEEPGDVRVLLVHHTVSSNTYSEDAVPGMLRSFFDFHTGPDKAWPDLAYNFCVDRFGRVWETRAGSIGAPVIGSATGGNQGFTQLCCFIGDHSTEQPSEAARSSMATLLGCLAQTYDIDVTPGATASFVSRGSNRHPAGTTVTTPTITGHRTMSMTACPGDAAMALIEGDLTVRAAAVAGGGVALTTTTSAVATTTSTEATTTLESATSTESVTSTESATTEPPTTASDTTAAGSDPGATIPSDQPTLSPPAEDLSAGPVGDTVDVRTSPLGLAAPLGLMAAGAAGLILLRRRGTDSEDVTHAADGGE